VSVQCDQPPLISFGVCGRKAITKRNLCVGPPHSLLSLLSLFIVKILHSPPPAFGLARFQPYPLATPPHP
jgi:hypothetical protein